MRRIEVATLVLVIAALLAIRAQAADPGPARQSERIELVKSKPALLFPSRSDERSPLVVFLHGMCAAPEFECPVFERGTQNAWLLCPPGPVACGSAGAMWTGDAKTLSKRITIAADAVLSKHGSAIDAERRILIGYSMGATAALRVVMKQPGVFQVLMIVNASVSPSAALLKGAGVKRIAFVSGDSDRSAAKLRRTAARLAKLGVDARYFALEKTGHYFDARSAGLLAVPLAWAVGGADH